MNKTELIANIAHRTELKKVDVEEVLGAFRDITEEELKKGEKVYLVNFGTFEVVDRAAREGRNPKTGETMLLPASKSPKFKFSRALKNAVNS